MSKSNGYAKYVSDFRMRLISKLRSDYALIRSDVEEFIQSYTTEYLNSEKLKDSLTNRDLTIAEKNKEIMELQHQLQEVLDAKKRVSNSVVSLFVKYRSGSVSPAELVQQLSNILSAYGWNV